MVRKKIDQKEFSRRRTFNGRKMGLDSRFSTRNEAKKEAEAIRRKGDYARLVKSKKGYEVFSVSGPGPGRRTTGYVVGLTHNGNRFRSAPFSSKKKAESYVRKLRRVGKGVYSKFSITKKNQ
jgi:hypothetical protein